MPLGLSASYVTLVKTSPLLLTSMDFPNTPKAVGSNTVLPSVLSLVTIVLYRLGKYPI